MSRTSIAVAATVLLAACPHGGSSTDHPRTVDDSAVRAKIAALEAARGAGVQELVELAAHGDSHARALAIRGLSRTGGTDAEKVIVAAVADPDREVAAAAAAGVGTLATLGDPPVAARLAHALDAAPRTAVSIEALGRAGDASSAPILIAALADPALAEQAALAFARLGRRKIELDAPPALIAATQSADVRLRYAATYAIARAQLPKASETAAIGAPDLLAALRARLADSDPETRAVAAFALAHRHAIDAARADLEHLLLDRDWRPAVEAVRALGTDDAGRDAIATAIVRRWADVAQGDAAVAHVVIEGEKAIAPAGKRPVVAAALAQLASIPASAQRVPALSRAWIECLAVAAQVRAADAPDYSVLAACGHGGLPDHLRLPLATELIEARTGTVAARRAALAALLTHKDVRVRAAGLGALAALWTDGDAGDRKSAVATLVAALGSPDPILAGAAADAATAIYALEPAEPDRAQIDAAIVARATSERDPEISAGFLALVGTRKLAAGRDACAAAVSGTPVRAAAGRQCLLELGAPAAAGPVLPASPPPVSLVSGTRVRWHLSTTRGEIVVALRPDVSPWAVAAITALTRRGFYDGLEFHRVVPDFVVQGGDPTQSGYGGPGFTLPAEPATLADGVDGYVRGGLGIADAGPDSGGSQWFIMHARAAHLDGRYTWIGAVERGQKSADALLIGDRVVRATIEVEP